MSRVLTFSALVTCCPHTKKMASEFGDEDIHTQNFELLSDDIEIPKSEKSRETIKTHIFQSATICEALEVELVTEGWG